jgi:hypothetical protein
MSAARSGEAEELTQQLEALKEISRVEVSAVQTELTALQVPHRLAPWAKSGSAGMLARCCSEPGQKMLCAWDATSSAAQLHSLTLSLSLSLYRRRAGDPCRAAPSWPSCASSWRYAIHLITFLFLFASSCHQS